MYRSNHLRISLLLVTTLLLSALSAFSSVRIYFDNTDKNWSTPTIHYWGSSGSNYPGVKMIKYTGDTYSRNIWYYDTPDGTTGILFNAGDGDSTKTGDFSASAGHVYDADGDTNLTLDLYLQEFSPADSTYYVYFDNSACKWNPVYIYYWDVNNKDNGWPGSVSGITYTEGDLNNVLRFEVPSNVKGIIFNNGDTQTADLTPAANHVYYFPAGGVTKKAGSDEGDISSYSQEGNGGDDPVINPGNNTYKVYFNNVSANWEQPYIAFSSSEDGVTLPGVEMELCKEPGIQENTWVYNVPKDSGYVVFSDGDYKNGESASGCVSQVFKGEDLHVYTFFGKYQAGGKDAGLISNFTGGVRDSENPNAKEYWIEPINENSGANDVTQRDGIVLYFDRRLGYGELANSDEIYIYPGVFLEGTNEWAHTFNWNNLPDKCKMSKVAGKNNIFSVTISPSIENWFGMSIDERADNIVVIFRDKAGKVKQDSNNGVGDGGDHYIPLKRLPVDPAQAPMGEFVSAEDTDGVITITGSKGGKLYITLYDTEIVKIFTLPASLVDAAESERTERRSISVVAEPDPNVTYSINDTEDVYEIAIEGGVTVRVDKTSCLITFRENGEDMLQENEGLQNTPGHRTVSFLGMSDAAFYGAGYNGNQTDISAGSWKMSNTQTGGWQQGTNAPHNICVPFYLSTSGYGVYFDDHYDGAVMKPSSQGSSYSTSSLNPIAYYYVGGGSMEKAMQNYVHLTGHQEMPPYWALGYITSKYSFESRSAAETAISTTRKYELPVDAIVFDIHWQGYRNGAPVGMGALDWDTHMYNNPHEMLGNFEKDNIKVIAITEPYFSSHTTFSTASSNYAELKKNGYLCDEHVNGNDNMNWIGQGSDVGLIDVANPDAMKWFTDKYVQHMTNSDAMISGWWLDLGEPEAYDMDGNTHHYGGDTPQQIRNEYGNLWISGVYDRLKKDHPEMRHIIMPRSGTAGMQRFSTFPWTGDILRSWGGLAAQVPALVNASMCGIGYLGSDVGGFTGNTFDELYLRWVELGVFYPMMRTHSGNNPEPYHRGNVDDIKKFFNMRYSYLPYTYTLSYMNTYEGKPIARPANYADINKNTPLKNSIDTYLWGPDIYVAPVLSNATSRQIRFPEGRWLDLNDGKTIYYGGSNYTYSAPLDKLPHFLREGGFATRYAADTYTNTASIDRSQLVVEHFVNSSNKYTTSIFYDDDRTSPDPVKEKKYSLTRFNSLSESGSTLITIRREATYQYDGKPEEQTIIFNLYGFQPGSTNPQVGFYADSETPRLGQRRKATVPTLTSFSSEAALKSSTSNGYYYDVNNSKMVIKTTLNPDEDYNLEVGEPGIMTGVESLESVGAMTLSYCDEMLSYSAPEGLNNLLVEVYGVTGVKVFEAGNLTADGTVHQIEATLDAGIYVARLTGRDNSGALRSFTAKVVSR